MKQFLLATMFASTALGSALGAEFTFSSAIDAVTVFPQGAEVSRAAAGRIDPGDHVVLISGLPANIIADSVRVEGMSAGGVSIGSVDVRPVYLGQDKAMDEERTRLDMQIQTLGDEFSRLEQVVTDTALQRRMLEALLTGSVKAGDNAAAAISAESLSSLLSEAATRLDDLGRKAIDARASQRDLQRQINDLQNRIAQLAPRNETQTQVAIHVNAKDAADARFSIRYAVQDAGWRAVYDADLSLEGEGADKAITVTRRAEVRQSTSEAWDNVALTLSTARPSAATDAPKLAAWTLDELDVQIYAPAAPARLERKLTSELMGMAANGADFEAEPMEEAAVQEAVMNVGGYQATYDIVGKVSIANTQESKSVVLGKDELTATVGVLSVPVLDPAAYLQAQFTLSGQATYLPGPVILTRDGAFIGRGAMPMLAPGDTHELGFGADDKIVVERVEKDRTKGETGLISTSNTDVRTFATTIRNLHDFAMPVTILDRLPVSNHENIRVAMSAATSQPTSVDKDDVRGLLEWTQDVAANGDATITFGYRIDWPKSMEVSGL